MAVEGAVGGPVGIFVTAIRGLTSDREATPGGIFAQAILTTQVGARASRQDVLDVQSGATTIAELRQRYGVDPPPPPPPSPDGGPRPGDNPPIILPSGANPFIVGSIYWGSKGPRKRRKVKRKKRRFPGIPEMSPGAAADYFPDFVGKPDDYRVPNPDVWGPDVLREGAKRAGRIILRGGTRAAGSVLGWILFPSETSRDDVVLDPVLDPRAMPIPKGPPQRPRVGRPYPYAWPLPDFQGKWRKRGPRIPGVLYPTDLPGGLPRTLPRSVPAPRPQPAPLPPPQAMPQPRSVPRPSPRTAPRGTPWPSPTPRTPPRTAPRPTLPTLLPYVLPFLFPSPSPRVTAQPRPIAPPVQSPLPIENPLTAFNPYRVPSRPDDCQCEKPRKRKKGCTNPISSKRTFSRGGARFRTVTRRLQCPV